MMININKKIPTYKEIQEVWPQDVDFSMYKVRIVKKLLKEKNPYWTFNTEKSIREYYLRLFIRDNILKFKPCTEVFDCEKGPVQPFTTGFNKYRIPCVTRPKGVFSIQICGGGFLNVRKSNNGWND